MTTPFSLLLLTGNGALEYANNNDIYTNVVKYNKNNREDLYKILN